MTIAIGAEHLRLYFVLDLHAAGGRAEAIARAALRGGITCLQLRDKRGSGSGIAELARALRPSLLDAGVPLIVNDRVDLAWEVGADGVHLGQLDESVVSARTRYLKRTGRRLMVGVSVATVAEAQQAVADGASYLSVSPLLGTATKPNTVRPAGFDGLRAIRAACPHAAIVAIGGIGVHNAQRVVEAGADGVAFVSMVTAVRQPESSVRALCSELEKARVPELVQ